MFRVMCEVNARVLERGVGMHSTGKGVCEASQIYTDDSTGGIFK